MTLSDGENIKLGNWESFPKKQERKEECHFVVLERNNIKMNLESGNLNRMSTIRQPAMQNLIENTLGLGIFNQKTQCKWITLESYY